MVMALRETTILLATRKRVGIETKMQCVRPLQDKTTSAVGAAGDGSVGVRADGGEVEIVNIDGNSDANVV